MQMGENSKICRILNLGVCHELVTSAVFKKRREATLLVAFCFIKCLLKLKQKYLFMLRVENHLCCVFCTNFVKNPLIIHLVTVLGPDGRASACQPVDVSSNPALRFCNKRVAENIPVLSGRLVLFNLGTLWKPYKTR